MIRKNAKFWAVILILMVLVGLCSAIAPIDSSSLKEKSSLSLIYIPHNFAKLDFNEVITHPPVKSEDEVKFVRDEANSSVSPTFSVSDPVVAEIQLPDEGMFDIGPGTSPSSQAHTTAHSPLHRISTLQQFTSIPAQDPGTGGTNVNFNLTATSANNQPIIIVLYPNGGESIPIGTQMPVSVHATDDTAVTSVTFYYSSNGGSS